MREELAGAEEEPRTRWSRTVVATILGALVFGAVEYLIGIHERHALRRAVVETILWLCLMVPFWVFTGRHPQAFRDGALRRYLAGRRRERQQRG